MKSPKPLCKLNRCNQVALWKEVCPIFIPVGFFFSSGEALPGTTSGYPVSLSLSLQACRVLHSFPERNLLPICSEQQKLYTGSLQSENKYALCGEKIETVSGRAILLKTRRGHKALKVVPSACTYPTSMCQYLHSSFHPATNCICVLSWCLVISHKVLRVMSKGPPVSQPLSVAKETLASVSQLNTKTPLPARCSVGQEREPEREMAQQAFS